MADDASAYAQGASADSDEPAVARATSEGGSLIRPARSPVFETARMYSGQIRPLAVERIFGVTTFELG